MSARKPAAASPVYHELALLLVRGDGHPRTADGIVAEVERALIAAFESGKRAAGPAARQAALREVRHVLAGAAAAIAAAARTVDAELDADSTLAQ